MFFSLYLMDEHPARVTGRSIFTMTKNIVATSPWLLKLDAILKARNFRLA